MKNIFTCFFRILLAFWLIGPTIFASAQENQNTLTDSVCHCRLVTDLFYGSFYGGSVDIYVGADASGMFFDTALIHVDFNQYGIANHFIDLPLFRWIRIDYQDLMKTLVYVSGPEDVVQGTFALYDENDSVICSGPEELEGSILLWNACNRNIPDFVTDFSINPQEDSVNLSWNNPIQTVSGAPLTSISRIEIRRNEQLIHSFNNVSPGGEMSYTDILSNEGTYQYTIQCFNEEGDGVPMVKHILYGSDLTLFNYSHNTRYTDTTCYLSISNDSIYTQGNHAEFSIIHNDSTKMWKISGYANLDPDVTVSIYAGEGDNRIVIEPDSTGVLVSHEMITLVFDIPAGATPAFHYIMECVNTLYEQPDTSIAIVPDSNGIIYVTQVGTGSRNGSSWANSTPWLNRALSIADTMTEKPVIWVAKGIYYGNPQMTDDDDPEYASNVQYAFLGRNGVNVYGSFSGNEPANYDLNLRDFDQNETVLDGVLHHTVVNVGAAEWNGFHIRRGTNGCGIRENSILKHFIISDCSNNGITRTSYEVGIIDSCSIVDNGGNGIAVGLINRISNSLISRNAGDGIRSGGTVLNCEITQNGGDGFVATSWMGFSHIGVVNCLIANNGGNGMCLQSNNYIVTNTTIVYNAGIGINLTGSGHEVRNCIVYGNNGASIHYPSYVNINNFVLNNCAVEGYYQLSSHSNIPLSSPDDTLGFHPGFVNPTAGAGNGYSGGDWHLLPNSICVNKGETYSDYFPNIDIEGNPRILHNMPDIGAYESAYSPQYEENKIIYVKADGEGDGSSWSNATSDLDKAIESAWVYGPNTRVWVAKGTYATQGHPFYIKKGLRLMGGFVGNEPNEYDVNLRNPLSNATILDGQNHNRVIHQTIVFDSSAAAVVDGFKLTHGQSDEGSGAYLLDNTTLSKCRLVNNIATDNGSVVYAMHNMLKQLLVDNNDGTGISATETEIAHCTVVRNNGHGVRLATEDINQYDTLLNSIVWGNSLQSINFASALARNNTSILHCAIENQIIEGEDCVTLSSDNESSSGPHFTNPTDSIGSLTNLGDWQIDSSSLCLNAGAELSDLYSIYTDLSGQSRVQNSKADIGALESPYRGEVLCRNIEVFIYEGESYVFYDTALTTAGWYERRWNTGETDSMVVLHLIVKQVVYVSVYGSGSKDGSSWANALDGQTATADGNTKLANVLMNAPIGTEFWIQSGTYYACSDLDANKSLILNEGVALYGGFAGNETSITLRDTNNSPTVFSGNLQNDTVVEHYSHNIFKTNEQNTLDNPILLDNIFVAEGYNNDHSGTALHIGSSSALYANRCRFHHHIGSAIANEGQFFGNYCSLDSNVSNCIRGLSYEQYYDYNSYYEGAAAFSNKISGVARFNHCEITYNKAPHNGAIFNMGKMSIDSSEVNYNKATEKFIGAIYNIGDLIILNTTLSYNQSYKFFSTVASFGSLIMRNCYVYENRSNMQNPMYYWYQRIWLAADKSAHIMSDGTADISYCVFTQNSQNSGTDGGCLHISGKANIHHCDFIKNICAGKSNSPYGFWGDENHHYDEGSMIIITFQTIDNDGGGIHVENGEVYAEDCVFDQQTGMSGTSASVRSGRLTLNHCIFSRNISYSDDDNSILTNRRGELIVNNSLFANNQNPIFNTTLTDNSTSIFTNCTFANNGSYFCHFRAPKTPLGCDSTWVNTDTAHVFFNNCIVTGDWGYDMSGVNNGCDDFYPNYTVNFTNTLFDTIHAIENLSVGAETQSIYPQLVVNVGKGGQRALSTSELFADATFSEMLSQGNVMVDFDPKGNRVYKQMSKAQGSVSKETPKMSPTSRNASDCIPDSLGNIYYCDPMFVNPTTVMGVDSAQNPLLYDFRLMPGSPCINSGDTTGLHLTADATDLDGGRRIKRCTIDRGCYEYGNIVYDTVHETICVEPESLELLTYNGHGFSIAQLNIGENSFTRTCDCHPDANDTVLTLRLFLSLVQHTEFDTVVCDSMAWNGMAYTQSGTFEQTLTDATGCDSVVTMHLSVNISTFSETVQEACGSYEWNGTTYTESGVYTQTFTNTVGCDSVVTLYLTVYHEVDTVIYDYYCNGSSYFFSGQELYGPGTYTHVGQTVHGCDSIVTLQLDLKQTYSSFLSVNLCNGDGYDFFGETLHDAGTYTQVLPTVFGCDSTIILTLTTGTTTYGALDVSICDGNSYNFYGQLLTEAGDYTMTLTNAAGCDSVVTLHLTVSNTDHTDFTDEACNSYFWNGETYTTSGDFTQTFTNAAGCDSVVTLHLTLYSTEESEFSIVSDDSCYIWNSQSYCTSGDYIQTLQTIHGCDSLVTLHLTITVGLNDYNGCDFKVYPNPTSNIVNVECIMKNEELGDVEIQVVDAYGRLVDLVETLVITSLQNVRIDLSHNASGIYFVKAVADGKTIAVRKVVKQ